MLKIHKSSNQATVKTIAVLRLKQIEIKIVITTKLSMNIIRE